MDTIEYKLKSYGVGAARPPAAQEAIHAPWAAEQKADAEVSHAHQPTGPATPAVMPEAARHVT